MNLSEEKILITGGTGFLGSNIIAHLIKKREIPQESISAFYLENTSTIAVQEWPKVELIPGNILDYKSLESACKGKTIVFHTVGSTSFEPRAKKIQWLINVEGTRNIASIVSNSNSIKKVVYTSTVNTLGVPNPEGSLGTLETSNPYHNTPKLHSFSSPQEILDFADSIHEGSVPDKWWKDIDIGYFDSKLAAQEIINRAVQENDLNIVSVLPGTFFGPRDYFIGSALYLIRIYNNAMPGVLKGGSPCMHVNDTVRGHLLALEKGKKGERYIITGKEEDNLYQKDMAQQIAQVLQEKEPDKKIRQKFREFKPFLAKIGAVFSELYSKIFNKPCVLSKAMIKAGSFPSFYSYEKAKKDLGYTPEKSFKEAVEDMFDFMTEHNLLSKEGREMDKILTNKDKKTQ